MLSELERMERVHAAQLLAIAYEMANANELRARPLSLAGVQA